MVVLKRVLISVPTLVVLTLVVFLLVKAVPGDPALLKLGERATPESLADLRKEMGLDRPWYVQYGFFVKKLFVDGDLGRSIRSGEPITTIISEKFPATIELATAAIIFAVIIGLTTGLLAAIWPGTIIDFFSMSIAVIGVSMPIFWLALVLLWVFGLTLGWFPLSGRLGIEHYYEPLSGFVLLDSLYRRDFSMFFDSLHHLVLPAIALGTIPMAFFGRITRAAMLEVMSQDYVRTAKAKGVSFFGVVMKHSLKNASIPIVTVIGLQFGLLLGGAIITETVFAWPGIGSWLLEAVSSRDFPAIEGGILLVASAFIFVNLVVDLLYGFLDPRMKVS